MKLHRSLWLAALLGASAYACHHDTAPATTTPAGSPQMAPATGDPGALPDPNSPGAAPGTNPGSPGVTPSANPMAPGAPGPTGPLQPGTTAPTSPNGTTMPGPTTPGTKPTTMGDAGSTRPPGSTGATNGDLGTPANRGGGAIGSTAQGMTTDLFATPTVATLPGPGDVTAMAADAGVGVTAPRDSGMPPGGGDAGVPRSPPTNPLPPTSPNGPGAGSGNNPSPAPNPGPGSGVGAPRPNR